MNDKNTGLKVAGAIFALVGLLHLLRIALGFELIIAGILIPVWVNGIGLMVAGALCAWLLALSRKQ